MDAPRYQASRSLFRALAPLLDEAAEDGRVIVRRRLLDACEYSVARLAENSSAPDVAARALFAAVRGLFPLSDQARVRGAIARAAAMAASAEQQRRAEARRCAAVRRDGGRCRRERRRDSAYCPSHAAIVA